MSFYLYTFTEIKGPFDSRALSELYHEVLHFGICFTSSTHGYRPHVSPFVPHNAGRTIEFTAFPAVVGKLVKRSGTL